MALRNGASRLIYKLRYVLSLAGYFFRMVANLVQEYSILYLTLGSVDRSAV